MNEQVNENLAEHIIIKRDVIDLLIAQKPGFKVSWITDEKNPDRIHKNTWKKIKEGEQVKRSTIGKLAKILGVSPSVILGRNSPEDESLERLSFNQISEVFSFDEFEVGPEKDYAVEIHPHCIYGTVDSDVLDAQPWLHIALPSKQPVRIDINPIIDIERVQNAEHIHSRTGLASILSAMNLGNTPKLLWSDQVSEKLDSELIEKLRKVVESSGSHGGITDRDLLGAGQRLVVEQEFGEFLADLEQRGLRLFGINPTCIRSAGFRDCFYEVVEYQIMSVGCVLGITYAYNDRVEISYPSQAWIDLEEHQQKFGPDGMESFLPF